MNAKDRDTSGMCLSWRLCARPSLMYSGVTSATVVVAVDAADVEQRGEDHAGLDGHGQIGEDRQAKGDDPHGRSRPAPSLTASGISRHSPMS